MAGFFSWLGSAKWVAQEEGGINLVCGSWFEHPKIGQWDPRDGGTSAAGVYRYLACVRLA